MKIRERKHVDVGLGGGYVAVRVRELTDGEPVPAGAEVVADETPVHDWQREA